MATIPLFKMDSDNLQHVQNLWENSDSVDNERNGLLATTRHRLSTN
jgi:hypothetical protein